jgi:hypothetical protein
LRKGITHIITLTMLFAFLLQACGNLVIVAEYFANKEYISKTLCINKAQPSLGCQGKCYMAKQLQKESEKESLPASRVKYEKEILFTQCLQAVPMPVIYACTIVPVSFYGDAAADPYSGDIFHPPQFMV